MNKIGSIECSIQSNLFRAMLSSNEGGKNVVTLVQIIDLDDNKPYRLICGAYLERFFLGESGGIIGRRFRIADGGIAPGKKYRIIDIQELKQEAHSDIPF